MNGKDRKKLQRVYGILSEMSKVPPSNPMNIADHARSSAAIRDVLPRVCNALLSTAVGEEYEDEVDDDLSAAEEELAKIRGRG